MRVPRKLWKRACLWAQRAGGNPFVRMNPRTSGYCAGYLAAMRDVAKKRAASRTGNARTRGHQLELFGAQED